MLYDVKTPEAYMNVLEDDWRREQLQVVRQLLLAHGLTEGINYKMLSYSDERGIVFHLNAQRGYVSLYVGDARKVDPEAQLLKGLNVGKGCIRIKKSVNIADTQLDQFIDKAVQLWKAGEDIDC